MNRRNFLTAAAASLAGLLLLRRAPAVVPVAVPANPKLKCKCPEPCLPCDMRALLRKMDEINVPSPSGVWFRGRYYEAGDPQLSLDISQWWSTKVHNPQPSSVALIEEHLRRKAGAV